MFQVRIDLLKMSHLNIEIYVLKSEMFIGQNKHESNVLPKYDYKWENHLRK